MISVVVLSYNRKSALERTLTELSRTPALDGAQVIVVDNASADGSADLVREKFPGVELLALDKNLGIEGFNRGAAQARGKHLLILDDDSWPDPESLRRAHDLLGTRHDLAAVTLLPVHPVSNVPEWPFLTKPTDSCPVMGCANLVKAKAWRQVGGYESRYFLYRNDADLAMTLLAAGKGVHADPTLFAWHDSPAAARKSTRWLRLATRNWIWMARRHARGLTKAKAILGGVAWALVQAGANPVRAWSVIRGVVAGLIRRAPGLPKGVAVDGKAFASLMAMKKA